MAASAQLRKRLLEYALGLPEAYLDRVISRRRAKEARIVASVAATYARYAWRVA
jgi:hypothetical protein